MPKEIWANNYHKIVVYEETPDGKWNARFPFSDAAVAGKSSKDEAYATLKELHDRSLQESTEYKNRFLAWVMANSPQISEDEYAKRGDTKPIPT